MSIICELRLLTVGILIGAIAQCSIGNAQLGETMKSGQTLPSLQSISGRVLDESGVAIVGAVIVQVESIPRTERYAVTTPRAPIVNRATTKEDGMFTFAKYEFENVTRRYIVHPDFPIQQIRMPLEVLGDIVVTQGQDIRGTILAHDGKPIEAAEVSIANLPSRSVIGSSQGRTQTDNQGRFVLKNVAIDGHAYLFVSTKEGLESRLTWYQDENVDNAASSLAARPNTTRTGPNFVFRMPETNSIQFAVVSSDSGEPVSVERVFAGAPGPPGLEGLVLGNSSGIVIEGNRIRSKQAKIPISRFWIFPSRDSLHPPFVFDVPSDIGEDKANVLVATVSPGCHVTGTAVDAETELPVENLMIQLIAEQPSVLAETNAFVPSFIGTDTNGKFSVVLPPGEVTFRVSGTTGNYRTIPNRLDRELPPQAVKKEDGTVSPGDPRFSVPEALQKKLQLDAGIEAELGTFRLRQGTVARGLVLDEEGEPLSNVAYITKPVRFVFGRGNFSKTNRHGEFEIDKLFSNGAEDIHSPFATDEAEVYFWDRENRLSATVKIKEQEAGNVVVRLKPAKSARGRVVDEKTGLPIEGVAIHGNASITSLHLGAVSDEDGKFMIDFIPENGLYISLRKKGFGFANHRISIPEDRLAFNIGDIAMTSKSAFGVPGKPNIKGLKPSAAIDALSKYVADHFVKIPPRRNRTSWSSDAPGDNYKMQVRNNVCRLVSRLLDDNADVEFQTELSIRILEEFQNGESTIHFNNVIRRMHKILLVNIDHAGVFPRYQPLAERAGSVGDFGLVLKHSKKAELRKWATFHTLRKGVNELTSGASKGLGRNSKQEFERLLGDVVTAWHAALNEFPDEKYQGETFESHVNDNMEALIKNILSKPHDKARLRAIEKAIQDCKESPQA